MVCYYRKRCFGAKRGAGLEQQECKRSCLVRLEKFWVLTGEEKREVLLYVVLEEHFICPPLVARKHVMGYCTSPQVDCNHIPGTLGVIPSAVHFFQHVRCCGHVFQLIIEEQAFF